MFEKQGIVVPLDGSETAARALGAAQALAAMLEEVLHIVYVTESPVPLPELMEALKIDELKVNDFVLHQIPGEVVETLVEFTARENARLIVMSSHGTTYDEGALMGHIALGIIQNSECPVMVVRPDMPHVPDPYWRPQKMLIPLNGSPSAAAVMDEALELAEILQCDVEIIHVAVLGEKRPQEVGSYATPRYIDYAHHEWSAWADEFMARFARQPPTVNIRLLHRQGVPADEMLRLAVESGDDLVLLGWQGRLEKDRAMTIKQLLKKTESPIILIRT
ncbi:MAG: universal stress protein [Thermoleophilia bacterium]